MMDSSVMGWFVLVGVLVIAMGFGYIAGEANPPKGEIILTTFGPHGCKGMPKARHWHEGTQWQCATCKDVWEVSTSYDGFDIENYWERLDKKTNFETYLEEQLKDPEVKEEFEKGKKK